MKNYIVPLALVVLVACQEEEAIPPKPDLFLGSWSYTDSYVDVELSTNFRVTKTGEDYTFSNIKIEYSEIPSTETLTYQMEVQDPYANGDGFAKIRIIGSWTTTCPNGMTCDKWIFVDFKTAKIYQKPGVQNYAMSVEEVLIHMINKNDVVLNHQELIKTSL